MTDNELNCTEKEENCNLWKSWFFFFFRVRIYGLNYKKIFEKAKIIYSMIFFFYVVVCLITRMIVAEALYLAFVYKAVWVRQFGIGSNNIQVFLVIRESVLICNPFVWNQYWNKWWILFVIAQKLHIDLCIMFSLSDYFLLFFSDSKQYIVALLSRNVYIYL